MILSQLLETITKFSTKEDLQKFLDIRNLDSKFRVVDGKTIEYIGTPDNITLTNIKTSGKLPFTIITNDRILSLKLNIPSLTTLKGIIKEEDIENIEITGIESQFTNLSLVGMPKVNDLTIVYSNIKNFLGCQVSKFINLNKCPNITSLKGLNCLKASLSNCNNFTFKNFPNSINHISLEYSKLTKAFAYYAQVPPDCKVILHDSNHDLIELLDPIRNNVGWNAGKKLLAAQSLLIDHDYSDEEVDV